MRRHVLALVTLHLVAVGGLGALAWPDGGPGSLATWLGVAAAYALAGLTTTHLELRRHAFTVSAQEGVLVVALLALGPIGVVTAVGVGELAACLKERLSPLKLLFNAAQAMSATSGAALVFAAGGRSGANDRLTWAWVMLAVGCFFLVNTASITGVVSRAEGRPFRPVLWATAGPALVTTVASASLGLLVVVLGEHDAASPFLLLPVLAILLLASGGVAAQRAERLRFERLYDASARTSTLMGLDEALATLADEARALVTGSAAMCCALDRDGRWRGAVVTDEGREPAGGEAVEALVALSRLHGSGHVDMALLSPTARRALPRAGSLVVAEAQATGAAQVVLGVFRELEDDRQGARRAEVLTAFSGHATLAVANAGLYADVEDALRRQIDLNRQKGEFVASVSHELRTPLTGVITAVATMRRLEDKLSDDQRDRLFTVATQSGERLRRLIDELLLVASAEHQEAPAGPRRPVDVAEVVDEVAAELSRATDGRLRVTVAPDVGTVVSDADKLRRIVANLVENAAKYAPEGPIDVDVTRADGALHLTVADRGPGVPAEDRERVFGRFVQLDQSSTRRNGGTGLGLYLCRKLAGALGGSLTVEEAAGGGACFRLTLPTEEPAASLGNAAGSPAPAVAASPAQRAAQARPPIEDATAPAASDAVSDYVAGGVA